MRFEFPTKPTETVKPNLIAPESWDDWVNDEWTPYVYDDCNRNDLTVRCYPVTRPITEED